VRFIRYIVYIFAVIGFVLVAGFFAVKFGWTNTPGIIDTQREAFLDNRASNRTTATNTPSWATGEEWQTLKDATLKDSTDIYAAAKNSGADARLIVGLSYLGLILSCLPYFLAATISFSTCGGTTS
jgi:hypothetical protein